jgi:glycosyltransferase involved in cell wall biosynthesis
MAENITPHQPHNPLEGERPELTLNLHEGTEEMVSIVVVHKDRPEYLNLTLQSISVCSFNNNYEIIVVDNGSGKESQDFLDEIDGEVKVVRNEKNLFWSEAANKGASAADKNAKYLMFMHHDVVVTQPAWIDLMIHVSQAQDAGLVGTELHSYYLQDQKVDFIQEWMTLMTRECFNDVGGWPEKLPQIGSAFIMTARCQFRGWKPQIMKNPVAHHYKVFALDVNDYERFSEQAMVTLPQLLRDAQNMSAKR